MGQILSLLPAASLGESQRRALQPQHTRANGSTGGSAPSLNEGSGDVGSTQIGSFKRFERVFSNPDVVRSPRGTATNSEGQSESSRAAERPQSLSMIRNATQATVTDSQLMMAGNNVNNYSVSVTLNGKPSFGRRENRPPAKSRTRNMVSRVAKKRGKANGSEDTNSPIASNTSVMYKFSGDTEVSLDHLDIDAHLAKTAGPV
ncbi:hypothetical protein BKA70DRAFT_866143 [Coprinopsis sp. MPI-PUGE-AT-0042]|nr:hypothetical protein BKA70DRAFT_866143 [Coprinopsis sp. MPI-PUGE-AT-0042]